MACRHVIPGQAKQHTRKQFRDGLVCGVVGCTRKARHEWAYPCAINTMAVMPAEPSWLPACDECDMELNRRLLEVVGVPEHVLDELLAAYALIQADGAFP